MEVNLEIVIASLALAISSYSLYHQFLHKDIIAYPTAEGEYFFLYVENIGQATISNFTIEIIELNEFLDSISMESIDKKKFKARAGLNGKGVTTLAPAKIRKFLLGSHKKFFLENGDELRDFPKFTIKITYRRFKYLKRVKKIDCDYNTFKGELSVQSLNDHLDAIDETLKLMVKNKNTW